MKETRLHFIGNSRSGDDLDNLRNLSWDEGIVSCVRHAWVWPLYCRLKMKGANVSFSYAPQEGAVNFIHGQVARTMLRPSDLMNFFFVGIRADFRPFPYGLVEIVQNRKTAGGRRHYMPHFPQPGLIGRDQCRRSVENICFAGQVNNSVIASNLVSDLKAMGCEYVIKREGEWQNLHNIDVLIGIRAFSPKGHHSKPPTKLFNAWLSGIPFIGGNDSAYGQVGTPGDNYLCVSSYAELLQAIDGLKNDPELYASLVEEGYRAVLPYTVEITTSRWEELIEQTIVPMYHRWCARDSRTRLEACSKSVVFGLYEKLIRRH